MKLAIIVRAGLFACALTHSGIGGNEGPAHAPAAGAANCLAKAKLNLSVSPQKVQLGQSATIAWDVLISDACGPVTIELDSQVVQTIVPTRSTNGRVPVWTSGYAIKIRGNPIDKAVVDGNVFKQASQGDAIAQNGDGGFGDNITNPIQVLSNNLFGIDPTQENLPVCDFAGDGQLDQFMAPGVTWWAKSPVTHQWRYLNTMPERLSGLQVGHFDNDAVCDVAPPSANPLRQPEKYSKSGAGPWVSLVNT
jgi:hypothetical protein